MTNKMKKILVISALLLIAAAVVVLVMVNPWQSDVPPTPTDPSNTVDTIPTGDPAATQPSGPDNTVPTGSGDQPTAPNGPNTDPTVPEPTVTQPTGPAGPGTDPTNPQPTDPEPTTPDPTVPQPTVPEPTTPKPTQPPVHTHSYTSKVKKEATCTAEGVKTFTCGCGHSYTESIAKVAHSYTSKVTKEATCTAEGVKTFTCKCGDSYTQPISKVAHAYTSKVTKEATCTAAGVRTFTCKCGNSYTETIAKLAHSYTSKVTAPTCTAKGCTTHTCKCGHSYTDQETQATGHRWGSWVTITQATETATGEAKRTCSACSTVETKVIPKGEHVHSYSDTVVKATCTEGGYTQHSCTCGHSYQDTPTEALGHATVDSVVAATCTEKGYCKRECTRCNYVLIANRVAAKGHSYSDWVTVTAPTATSTGLQSRTCSTCGNVNTQVLPKTEENLSTYIDPRIEVERLGPVGYTCVYADGKVQVRIRCSWDCRLSIYVRDDNGLDVTYYQQDGTKVTCTVEPPPAGHWRSMTIDEDGSYGIGLIGSLA